MPSRCFIPRDRPPIGASRLLSRPTRVTASNAAGNRGRLEFVGAGEIFEILVDGELVVEREKIRNIADILLGLFAMALHVNAVDEHAAGRGQQQPADHLEGGGFAGTVRSDESEHFARRHLEIQAIRRENAACRVAVRIVFPGEIDELEHDVCPSLSRGYYPVNSSPGVTTSKRYRQNRDIRRAGDAELRQDGGALCEEE